MIGVSPIDCKISGGHDYELEVSMKVFLTAESSEFFQFKRARIRKSQPRKARKAEVVAITQVHPVISILYLH
jgi:hypothetical protein